MIAPFLRPLSHFHELLASVLFHRHFSFAFSQAHADTIGEALVLT